LAAPPIKAPVSAPRKIPPEVRGPASPEQAPNRSDNAQTTPTALVFNFGMESPLPGTYRRRFFPRRSDYA
jgi:hypothetical protein